MAKIVIQMLTHGGMDVRTLAPLFGSLVAQTERDFEVFWWDNGAPEAIRVEQRKALAEHAAGLNVTRFEHPTNIGFAGGHQALYEKHNADYVILLNDDAFFMPKYIELLRAAFDADPNIAAASGLILRWDFDANNIPVKTDIIDTAGTMLKQYHAAYDAGAGESHVHFKIPQTPFGVSGCVPMYRRSAIGNEIFDPSYFFYKEDIDLAYRLRNAGFKAVVVPEAIAYHRRTFRPGERSKVKLRVRMYSYRNHIRNLTRNLTLKDWLHDGWAIIPYELVKFMYLAVMDPKVLYYSLFPSKCPTT